MRRIIIALTLTGLAMPAAAGQPVTANDMKAYEAQMKKAQEVMNSPEYQRQMRQAMDPAAMKQMQQFSGKAMEAAMGLNACMMEKIGEDGMNRMAKRGEEINAEMEALCAAGKRDEAEAAMKGYAKEMMGSKEYRAMRGCAEKYRTQMDDPSMAAARRQLRAMEGKPEKADICG